MPNVERYRDSTRGVWRYRGRYLDAAGKKRSRTFDTKAAALRWAGEEEAKVHRGQRSDPVAAKMRWSDWCDRWLGAKQAEPWTRRTDASTIRVHVMPRWGTTPLLNIARIDVQAWVNELARKRSARTTRKALSILSVSLSAAVDEGIISANPCAGVKTPAVPTGQERYLEDVEIDRIFYHLDGRYRVLAELLLRTGLRAGEACGLHVARVDLPGLRLHVVETYGPSDGGGGAMRPYPKSKRRREVPLTRELADLLRDHLDRNPPGPSCRRLHRGGRCPGGLLITGPHGAPIDAHNFRARQWADACARAGVEDVRVHDLRHTYASRLLQRGIPLERVQLLLGHSSITTTSRYAHLVPDDWDDVRVAMSASTATAPDGAKRLRAL